MDELLLTRRNLLQLCGLAGASYIFGERIMAEESLIPAIDAVDHLLLGISDLDRGIAWCEKMTGVKPVIGGSHPGAGTRNALLSLGGKRYLEIIAPDPEQSGYNFQIDVRNLTEPRIITWAAGTKSIDAIAKKAQKVPFEIYGPRDGSRSRPDGKVLKWKIVAMMTQFGQTGIDPFPFFIEWAADSLHPSQDSPEGCKLESFEIEHPKPEELSASLRKLDIDITVKKADNVRQIATLNTPKGKVVLS